MWLLFGLGVSRQRFPDEPEGPRLKSSVCHNSIKKMLSNHPVTSGLPRTLSPPYSFPTHSPLSPFLHWDSSCLSRDWIRLADRFWSLLDGAARMWWNISMKSSSCNNKKKKTTHDIIIACVIIDTAERNNAWKKWDSLTAASSESRFIHLLSKRMYVYVFTLRM